MNGYSTTQKQMSVSECTKTEGCFVENVGAVLIDFVWEKW